MNQITKLLKQHTNILRVAVIALTIAVSIAVSAGSVLAWPINTGP